MRLEDLNDATQQQLLASGLLRPGEAKRKKSHQASREDEFAFALRAHQLPPAERQYRFALAMGRQWRFDFAWPRYHLAVEIEGLVVTQMWERAEGALRVKTVVTGRHATISGFREDIQKYNAAAELGWSVLRFEQTMVKSGEAVQVTRRLLERKGWTP